jgi:chemosensory pili system protein ChpA (sensor histidine kinase/response regulator)
VSLTNAPLQTNTDQCAINILVVDDDEAMRELVKVHLTNAGYRVTLAEDAVAGGRMLYGSTPDLLIMDAEMPYMNGFDFVATMLSDATAPRVPVIVITAHERFVERAVLLGVDCLKKPFFADQLLGAVERALGSQR